MLFKKYIKEDDKSWMVGGLVIRQRGKKFEVETKDGKYIDMFDNIDDAEKAIHRGEFDKYIKEARVFDSEPTISQIKSKIQRTAKSLNISITVKWDLGRQYFDVIVVNSITSREMNKLDIALRQQLEKTDFSFELA